MALPSAPHHPLHLLPGFVEELGCQEEVWRRAPLGQPALSPLHFLSCLVLKSKKCSSKSRGSDRCQHQKHGGTTAGPPPSSSQRSWQVVSRSDEDAIQNSEPSGSKAAVLQLSHGFFPGTKCREGASGVLAPNISPNGTARNEPESSESRQSMGAAIPVRLHLNSGLYLLRSRSERKSI